MDYIKFIIPLLFLVSCKTTKKAETYESTHFEASDVKATQMDLVYKVVTENRKGLRVIRIYDTSMAKETEDGFVSPLAAEITESDTTTIVETNEDIVVSERNGKSETHDYTHTEEYSSRKKLIGNSLLVLLVGTFLLIAILKARSIFHVK